MELNPEDFKRILPLPVTLITTMDSMGVANGAPYGCVMPILRPFDLIALASAPPRDTLRNIRETGEFIVNVVGRPSFKKAMRCAKAYPAGVDEMKEVELAVTPARKVRPPRMKDAVGWIECQLEREVTEERYVLIIGRVLCAEINDDYMKNGDLEEFPLVMVPPRFRLVGETYADRNEFQEIISSH